MKLRGFQLFKFMLVLGLVFGLATTGVYFTGASQDQLVMGVSVDKLFLGRQEELRGVREAADEAGVKLLESVADNDAQRQNSQIQTFINRQVDAIMVVAVDRKAIVSALQAAKSAGIPVVTFDRSVPDVDIDFHAGLDSYADGYSCGQYIASQYYLDSVTSYDKKYFGEKPIVFELLGALNDSNALQRRDGFEDALKDAGVMDKIELIRAPMEWKPSKALSATENAFSKNPNIWAIQVPHDGSLEAVLTAIEGAGRLAPVGGKGHVHTCTIDGSPPGYENTAAGLNDAVVALRLKQLGKAALEAAKTVATGGTLETSKKGFPGRLFTYENIERYADQVWGSKSEG